MTGGEGLAMTQDFLRLTDKDETDIDAAMLLTDVTSSAKV
jgi:hypothetical protein